MKSVVNYRKPFNRKNEKSVLSHEPGVNWRNDGNVTAESSYKVARYARSGYIYP
jgi:hypothetical protein